MIREHDRVVLTCDVAAEKLKAGDVGTVVHVHKRTKALEVEFLTLGGDTVTVTTLLPSQLRSVRRREITHARMLATG